MKDRTRLIHAGGGARSPLVKTVGPPIQKGSTVLLPNAAALYDEANHLTYGREGLAAHDALRVALGEMEGAVGVSLYPSGLAALTGALLALLKAGDEVLAADSLYKPTRRFCDNSCSAAAASASDASAVNSSKPVAVMILKLL